MRIAMKKIFKKNEKGQVLVILALIIVTLVAIMGLAIDMGYMYVSYARLRREVDAAALSATAQFKRGASPADILNAAQQFMALNNEPYKSIMIENCYYTFDGTTETNFPPYVSPSAPGGSGDSTLCTNPPRKLIRVTAREDVPTFFLAVIGWKSLPIAVDAISEAASLEMVMVLDQSESMAWFQAPPNNRHLVVPPGYPSNAIDPKQCNVTNSCHPFAEVKAAAHTFVSDYIYFPYDRVAIVTFAKHASIYDPKTHLPISDISKTGLTATPALTNNIADLTATIDNLKVTEGAGACHHPYATGGFGGPGFPDGYDHYNQNWMGDPGHPILFTNFSDTDVPCRLYDILLPNDPDPWPGDTSDPANPEQYQGVDSKIFYKFDCPQPKGYNRDDVDYSHCWTSNPGEGLLYASAVYGDTPDLRQQALWVTLLLTDGNANAAYYVDPGTGLLDNAYCPSTERNNAASSPDSTKVMPQCRDDNALVRHCLEENNPTENYYCKDQNYGIWDASTGKCTEASGIPAKFCWPASWYADPTLWKVNTVVANQVDVNKYDADDYARDQADGLADGAHSSIFAIGLGDGASSDQNLYVEDGTPPAGVSLLQYIAQKGGTDTYYLAQNDQLPAVFLAIANKIATRLTH